MSFSQPEQNDVEQVPDAAPSRTKDFLKLAVLAGFLSMMAYTVYKVPAIQRMAEQRKQVKRILQYDVLPESMLQRYSAATLEEYGFSVPFPVKMNRFQGARNVLGREKKNNEGKYYDFSFVTDKGKNRWQIQNNLDKKGHSFSQVERFISQDWISVNFKSELREEDSPDLKVSFSINQGLANYRYSTLNWNDYEYYIHAGFQRDFKNSLVKPTDEERKIAGIVFQTLQAGIPPLDGEVIGIDPESMDGIDQEAIAVRIAWRRGKLYEEFCSGKVFTDWMGSGFRNEDGAFYRMRQHVNVVNREKSYEEGEWKFFSNWTDNESEGVSELELSCTDGEMKHGEPRGGKRTVELRLLLHEDGTYHVKGGFISLKKTDNPRINKMLHYRKNVKRYDYGYWGHISLRSLGDVFVEPVLLEWVKTAFPKHFGATKPDGTPVEIKGLEEFIRCCAHQIQTDFGW